MTLRDITEKIVTDAHVRKESLIEEAERTAGMLAVETEKAISKLEDTHDQNLKSSITENESRVRATATQEARMKVEGARQHALMQVSEQALQRIVNYTEQEYQTLVEKLIARIDSPLSGTLTCPTHKTDLTVRALKKAGHTINNITDASFKAGFVLTTDTAVFNFNVETLIARAIEDNEVELAHLLFPSN